MNKSLTIALLVIFCLPFSANAQLRKYISVGAGLNQSSFFIQPGWFQEKEFKVIFNESLLLSPEFNVKFNLDLDPHHSVSASVNVAVYRRAITVAIPIILSYSYDIIDQKNTPFLRADLGYSFFLTNGAFYGVGFGYKYGLLRGSLAYGNQLKRASILENNLFRTGRLAAIRFSIEYMFQRNRKGNNTFRRKRK